MSEKPSKKGLGPPPLPNEHGAWAILYLPMVITAVLYPPNEVLALTLFVVTTTALFLLQRPVVQWLRGRKTENNRWWSGIYGAAALVSGMPLLIVYRRWLLLPIALAGVLFFVVYQWMIRNRRRDRTVQGELLSAAALTLSGPATCIAGRGTLSLVAIWLWLGCILFFAGGIIYVKTWLRAAKLKKTFSPESRWVLGRPVLALHAGMLLASIGLATAVPWLSALLIAVALLPALLRTIWGVVNLSPKPPSLKRVGFLELGVGVWFATFVILAVNLAQGG